MKPNAEQLAMRDPALAALMGAIGGDESDFGAWDDDMGGYEFGYEFGVDPSSPIAGTANLAPIQKQALLANAVEQQMMTKRRTHLLEPNRGSVVKVERYAFAVNQALTLGTAVAIDASGSPDTNLRPQRVTMNAPSSGFATISEIKVANVSVSVGGTQDAFDYNALGVGQSLDMPTLSPANRARVLGNYTGFVPPGFVGGAAYTFAVSFKGPASIIA